MQYAIYPRHFINITQGVNYEYSHQGLNALDNGWKTGVSDSLFAPFDGKVVYLAGNTNVLAFESLEPVKWADGTEDYMTVITCHDNNPPKLNATFKQGEAYSALGTAGGVGKHCHLEVQKGHFVNSTTKKITGYGGGKAQYSIIYENTVVPYEVMYLAKGTTFSEKEGRNPYTWKTEPDDESDYKSLYEAEVEKNKALQLKIGNAVEVLNG